MVVVTGGTGHIGNVLVRELVSSGETVRVVVPSFEDTSSIKDLNLQIVNGDVRDLHSLIRAFEGTGYVYHLAGIVSIGSGRRRLIQEVNIGGTKNVIEACLQVKVKRMVYVSSIHAFTEPPHGTPITETKVFDPYRVKGQYGKSKAAATKEVLEAVKRGLDVVIVHPTGVIGPYEYKTSNMGQLIVDFMRRKLYAYIDGAYDFVDVRDVARGIILACKNGTCGENYILSGEQIAIRQILDILQESTGVKAPKFKIPMWLAKITGPFSELYYHILKQPPLYTTYSVSTIASNSLTSHKKASLELGYTARPIRDSIIDTVKWLKDLRVNH